MQSHQRKLVSSYRAVSSISPKEILEMHSLFSQFYANAEAGTFLKDMSKKDGVILVHEQGTGVLKGFSTIVRMPLWDGKREATGVFSGDTIVDPAYWGDRALKDGFARYMLRLKASAPTRPLYWLLISKGYKTYLLLANNFTNYYPRHDRDEDPRLQRIVEAYCNKLFPGKYDRSSGTLDFGDSSQHLKDTVAPIDEETMDGQPAIRFFAERNPEWTRGVELPCVGEVTVSLLWPYIDKQRRKLTGERPATTTVTPKKEAPRPMPFSIVPPPMFEAAASKASLHVGAIPNPPIPRDSGIHSRPGTGLGGKSTYDSAEAE